MGEAARSLGSAIELMAGDAESFGRAAELIGGSAERFCIAAISILSDAVAYGTRLLRGDREIMLGRRTIQGRTAMAKVQVTSEVNIDTEQLLEGVAQLDTRELTHFLSQVGSILVSRGSLPVSEAALIQQINQGLPAETQQHYDELQAKLSQDTISQEEHQILLELIDVVELASTERLKHLIALAQLRQVSVDEVMQQLEIQTPPVHV